MMKSEIAGLITFGLSMMNDMNVQQEERKEQILAEWRKTKDYPRKKKKRVRRELQLDYSIACWNPFDF